MTISTLRILLITATIFLFPTSSFASDYTLGATGGVGGFGLYVSGATHVVTTNGGALGWRSAVEGLLLDEVDNDRIGGNRYRGQLNVGKVQLGLDWYPTSTQLFVASGIAYTERNSGIANLYITPGSGYEVGNQRLGENSGVVLALDFQHESVAPYISIGIGNRHRGDSEISLYAEIGAYLPLSGAEVDLSIRGNMGVVTPENLALERQQIVDSLNDPQLIAQIGLGMHF